MMDTFQDKVKIENINLINSDQSLVSGLTKKQKGYLPVKRAMDVILSGSAIVMLLPILAIIAIAIKIDSPGPVLFKQKRIGRNKELFEIWKFRTMLIDTPKDVPTHMLKEPEAFITKTGKFLRKTSLDELPQIFNILRGQMSIIGPRPALWNQDDLIVERDKYGANDVKPGLTGWAQINGRDELEIPVKASFDGEYVKEMSLCMDIKCFLGTIGSVLSHDGVVEGGTSKKDNLKNSSNNTIDKIKVKKNINVGAIVVIIAAIIVASVLIAIIKSCIKKRESYISNKKHNKKELFGLMFFGVGLYKRSKCRNKIYQSLCGDITEKDTKKECERDKVQKKILITGSNSYIGMSVEKWLKNSSNKYVIDTIDMMDSYWKSLDFSRYDVVYHVAGIAHTDIGTVTEEQKQLYYKVNTELAYEVAEKAKSDGVYQFIFMSSMIVYSGCDVTMITSETEPRPLNFYGDSKWQADKKIRSLSDGKFKVVVLRPPMIYGRGSKGNYPELAKLATKLPIFPEVKNQKSILYIDNLCEFVKLMIDNEEEGVFFPQNEAYMNTSELVEMIASVRGHNIIMISGMSIFVKTLQKMPGKIGILATKAFGDFSYKMEMSEYKENYRVRTLTESIHLTEKQD